VVLIVGVCLIAAWLPYLRIRRIDPASVLRG
jgi:ABC-type antimicrobial peptide transport system permease subunit